jgi:hypothetical protein
MELKIQVVEIGVLIVSSNEVQPHRISLPLRVVSNSPRAYILCQYIGGRETQDSAGIIGDVQIRDGHGEMPGIQLHINCGTTRICMSP